MYEFEVSYDSSNDDPIKTEVQILLNNRKQALTSFDCYRILIGYILENAARADDKYAFMDEGLSDLEVVNAESTNNQKIKFRIKSSAVFAAQVSVFERKAAALKGYLAFLKSQGGANVIKDYYPIPGAIYKVTNPQAQPPTLDLADDLAQISSLLPNLEQTVATLKTETDPKKQNLIGVTKAKDDANLAIAIISSKKSEVITYIEAVLTSSFEVSKSNLLKFFNSNAQPIHKQWLLAILLEEFAKRSAQTPKTIVNRLNIVKVPATLSALNIVQVTDTSDPTKPQTRQVPNAVMAGSSDFNFWLSVIRAALNTLAEKKAVQAEHLKPLLFSVQEDVIYPAMRRLRDRIKAHLRLDELEIAGNLEFDGATMLAGLVAELTVTINSLLEKVLVTTSFSTVSPQSKKTINQKPLKFYAFDDLNEYAALMSQKKAPFGIENNQAVTFFNSTYTPLLRVDADALTFFNCEDYLYLADWSDPPSLNFLDDSGNVKNSVPLSAEDADATKRAQKAQAIAQMLAKIWPRMPTFQLRFLPLYLLKKDGSQIATQLMWLKTTGRTQGVGRSDEIDNSYYLWSFAGDLNAIKGNMKSPDSSKQLDLSKFNEQVIGSFLGLDAARCMTSQYVQSNKHVVEEKKNKISYLFLRYARNQDAEVEDYVLCNTPEIPMTSPLHILKFYYFRKVGFGGYDLVSRKVLKASAKPKNRPRGPDLPAEFKDNTNIGLNLPVSLNLAGNYQVFNKDKKGWGVIKNKGNWLKSNRRLRKDGAKVMGIIKKFSDYLPQAGKTLAANALVGSVIIRPKASADWRTLKLTSLSKLPTDQEWCHLQGHGDSGEERVGNFVSGSKHCNTEQLAIEDGHRPITHHAPINTGYRLNASAYLLDDDSMKELAQAPKIYLLADKNYEANAFINNLQVIKGKQKNEIETIGTKDLAQSKDKAPVAKFVRYKISRVTVTPPAQPTGKAVTTSVQVFDYVFEGQSEFFDKNQYSILTNTVRFMLDPERFLRELTDFYIQNYLTSSKAGK